MEIEKKNPGKIDLSLCENPLPPIPEAMETAEKELKKSNHYTEKYSEKLKEKISEYTDASTEQIHINAGSELILRQVFSLLGDKAHLTVPTYPLFEDISSEKTFTYLQEEKDFQMDLSELEVPPETTLVPIVNPNNPTGGVFNLSDNLDLLEDNPDTWFLVDEAFIEFAGKPVSHLVDQFDNLVVTRTFSKAFSLAGFRVGYAILPEKHANYLNENNDAYPLCRAGEAAAIASLENIDKINQRVDKLKEWAEDLSSALEDLGIKTYPTQTYFFLAKIPGMSAREFKERLSKKGIVVKEAEQEGLGDNFIKFMASEPEVNKAVVQKTEEILH